MNGKISVMFDVAVWGTVGQWVSGLASSGALVVGATVLTVDLHRKRRAQALSVAAWHSPSGKGVKIFVQNHSDAPIYNCGVIVQPKSTADVDRLVAVNSQKALPDNRLPPNGHKSDEYMMMLLLHRFNDEGDVDHALPPGKEDSSDRPLDYSPRAYHFYVFFSDASGRRWVRDTRTSKLLNRRSTRRVHPGESWLKQIFDFEC